MMEEQRHVAAILRQGSRSFDWAATLLPKAVRFDAQILYAFCREADDAIDEAQKPQQALRELTQRLERVAQAAAQPQALPDRFDLTDRALRGLLRRHPRIKQPLLALLEGFSWDADHRRYVTLEDTLAYCARVAASVGVAMTVILGRSEPWVLARAADLGTAMQLTNIARDVGEDALRGRVYLPETWLHEAGLSRQKLLERPKPSALLATQIARLLRFAQPLYERALLGVCALPYRTRPAIVAAALIYQDIGRSLAQEGFDGVSRRAWVRGGRKAWLVTQALTHRALWPWPAHRDEKAPLQGRNQLRFAQPLAANAFLICAPGQRHP